MSMLKFYRLSVLIVKKTALLLLFLFGNTSFADDISVEEQLCINNDKQCLARPQAIRGDYFKAILIAYNEDIYELLHQRSSEATTDSDRFISLLENNDFSIKMEDDKYIVQFGPTLRGKGYLISGGYRKYIISSVDFKILKKIKMR